MLDAVTLGELLIDFIPREKDLSKYPDFRMNAGGAPANVAVGCSQLELDSGFIGKVGNDVFGRALRDTLRDKGVDTSSLKLEEEGETRIGIVSVVEGEWYEYFYGNPFADELLRKEEIDPDFLDNSKLFHFGTISMIEEPSRSATLRAIEIAEEKGLTITMDPNFRPDLWSEEGRAKKLVDKVIDKVDILKLNDDEIRFFFDGEMETTAAELAEAMDWVLVTLGEDGCYYTDGDESGYTESYEVEEVDETGGGDAFMSGTIYGYLNDWDIEKTTEFANAAAALTIQDFGVIPSLPTKEEVLEFMG
ncbi:hypothetical protein AKJ65_06655 [candidate division MSBL1 archaeon SCGC-AAA259E19]|uniref:Carbohydrate kinase PfkB domain-containing protein n=1 Tax=candidate division MSBL1 archaeon SCGC-AAA259E19 TaxID=1698264 RepID=A0A133UG18_9EURY|nr:hypothetical protein AKJ65_06655 [candidate division MSBL1 archaeon SCGC-AAA259E19]